MNREMARRLEQAQVRVEETAARLSRVAEEMEAIARLIHETTADIAERKEDHPDAGES